MWNVARKIRSIPFVCSLFVPSLKNAVKHWINTIVSVKCALQKTQANSAADKKNSSSADQFEAENEFYSKERFATVQDALKIFQDDDLMFKPGKVLGNELQCEQEFCYGIWGSQRQHYEDCFQKNDVHNKVFGKLLQEHHSCIRLMGGRWLVQWWRQLLVSRFLMLWGSFSRSWVWSILTWMRQSRWYIIALGVSQHNICCSGVLWQTPLVIPFVQVHDLLSETSLRVCHTLIRQLCGGEALGIQWYLWYSDFSSHVFWKWNLVNFHWRHNGSIIVSLWHILEDISAWYTIEVYFQKMSSPAKTILLSIKMVNQTVVLILQGLDTSSFDNSTNIQMM